MHVIYPWDKFQEPSPAWRNALKQDGSELPSRSEKPVVPLVIIGAGLAGCWLARILAEQGISVLVLERNRSVAAGASGNPAGIVKPYVTRTPGRATAFHQLAHRYLLNRLQTFNLTDACDFNSCGVLQLLTKPYPESELFENMDAKTASVHAGTHMTSGAISFAESGWLNPRKLCESLIKHPLVNTLFGQSVLSVSAATSSSEAIQTIELQDGTQIRSNCIVFTSGADTTLFDDKNNIPIIPARGQISEFKLRDDAEAPRCVVAGKHYVIPKEGSVLVGASFHRGDRCTEITELDHASNLAGLKQLLPSLCTEDTPTKGYAGVRATTPDRFPVVGPLPDFDEASRLYADIHHGRNLLSYPNLPIQQGNFALLGLGSRGIVTAPFCAQLLASHITGIEQSNIFKSMACIGSDNTPVRFDGDNTTIDSSGPESLAFWSSSLNPGRFLIRQLKKAQSKSTNGS